MVIHTRPTVIFFNLEAGLPSATRETRASRRVTTSKLKKVTVGQHSY